jgi:hypothetical protein
MIMGTTTGIAVAVLVAASVITVLLVPRLVLATVRGEIGRGMRIVTVIGMLTVVGFAAAVTIGTSSTLPLLP